jgi:hypothetical protein
MDFSTIKLKLAGRVYDSPQCFIDDVNLVFDNCIAFNGLDSFIGKIAVNL